MKKRILCTLMAVVMSFGFTLPVQAANVAVQKGYKGSGGITLNLITVTPDGFRPDIVLANDRMDSAENVNSMLERAKTDGDVAAAFVGTFFGAYDDSKTTYGAIYRNGEALKDQGYYFHLVFTEDKKWQILDRTEMFAMDVSKVIVAVGCDPRLVKNGVKSIEPGHLDEKFMNATAQRTLIGVKKDGTLVVATGVTNFNNAADTLVSLDCVDGMAMDGGASSFMYANGETLQRAGRELNNIVVLYEIPTPPPITAVPTASKVFVNDEEIAFDAYTIEGNSYFKLRDLAFALNATEKRFDVLWDETAGAINLVTNTNYTIAGGEMAVGSNGTKNPTLSSSKILVDGGEISLAAYNIDGNNYFKLRDLCKILNIAVSWDESSNAIKIDTSKPYADRR